MMKLYTPFELEQLQQDLPCLTETMQWVQNFLARKHPDLGRPGPVCPFVPQALKTNTIRLAVVQAKSLNIQQIEELVLDYRDAFLEIEPTQKEAALNKAFLIVFPDISIEDTTTLIDGIQQKLKPLFVQQGLMLGEFHKRNESPGLHNPHFRPLQSPIPMLAIRFMVESDLPFLETADNPHLRIKYLEAYLRLFANDFKDANKLNRAAEILVLTKKQLLAENQELVQLASVT